MKPKLIRLFATSVILSAFTLPAMNAAEATPNPIADNRPVIGLEQKTAVKVVIQMTSGETTDKGVSGALMKVRKIHQDYLDEGVSPGELSLRVVIHGEASDHILTDAAWNERKDATEGNPSTELISELVEKGIHLELCNSRRIRNGWEKSEIHPGLTLVGNAYLRLADLQQKGYSYVRL